MKLYTHRKAILSAIHQARKEHGYCDATRTEDAATLLSVRDAARSIDRPERAAEAHRKKLLANLSKSLSKANAALDEARKSSDAMAALRGFAPEDMDGEAVETDLNTLTIGVQAFAELSAHAARVPARRITIEVLLGFFSFAYKRHTRAVPTVRRYDGGHEQAGKAYGPYLDYICAVAAALEIECSREGVASAFKRIGEAGKDWVREPYRPAEERFRGYLATLAGGD